jgi:hypothetical protein
MGAPSKRIGGAPSRLEVSRRRARLLDGRKSNFKKQVDYAVWVLLMINFAVVFSIGN